MRKRKLFEPGLGECWIGEEVRFGMVSGGRWKLLHAFLSDCTEQHHLLAGQKQINMKCRQDEKYDRRFGDYFVAGFFLTNKTNNVTSSQLA